MPDERGQCGGRTFPLGGLVNHSVQSCASGCLTLKCSGSWKTVTILSAPAEDVDASSPSASMGIESRGTGD